MTESSQSNANPLNRKKRSTLADLAKELEVNPSTISLALRDSPKVSSAMKEKIRDLCRRRGYVPNAHARALAQGRSTLLGVLLPCAGLPFYSMMLEHLYEQAAQRGYQLEAQFHQWDRDREISALRLMIEHRAEGIIAFSSLENPPQTLQEALFQNASTPISFWGRQPTNLQSLTDSIRGFVTMNVRLGAEMAANHLLDLGHRLIAYPLLTREWPGTEETIRGLSDAIKLHRDAKLITVELPTSFSSAARGSALSFEVSEYIAQQVLNLTPLPTAVVTSDDTMAQVLLAAFQRRGIKVPENVSIVCSGDSYYSRYGAVPLSCISAPLSLISEKLIDLVTGAQVTGDSRQHIFQPYLIPRASSGPPPPLQKGGSSARARRMHIPSFV